MAAGNFTFYNNGKLRIANDTINWASDAIAAVLLTATYTPSASHSLFSDLTNEVTGGGYAEVALTTKTVAGGSGTVTFDADDVNFGSSTTITAKYIVLVKGTAGSLVSGSLLLGYVDLNSGGGSVASTSGSFVVVWNASGVFTLA